MHALIQDLNGWKKILRFKILSISPCLIHCRFNLFLFQICVGKCEARNCSGIYNSKMFRTNQPWYERVTRWSCIDDCKYNCMWRTVEMFHQVWLFTKTSNENSDWAKYYSSCQQVAAWYNDMLFNFNILKINIKCHQQNHLWSLRNKGNSVWESLKKSCQLNKISNLNYHSYFYERNRANIPQTPYLKILCYFIPPPFRTPHFCETCPAYFFR